MFAVSQIMLHFFSIAIYLNSGRYQKRYSQGNNIYNTEGYMGKPGKTDAALLRGKNNHL